MSTPIHDAVEVKTRELEDAVYAALDACDAYLETVRAHLAAETSKPEPNAAVVKRLKMFEKKASAMVTVIEDDAITEMLSLIDRLHALGDAELGIFI
jgi:hypothetical protein